MGIFCLVVIICLPALGYGYYVAKKNNERSEQLLCDGVFIKRDRDPFKLKNIFFTSISDISQIGSDIDIDTLSNQHISFEPAYDRGAIVFHNKASGGSFGASIRTLGKDEMTGLYTYEYMIRAWRERRTIAFDDLLGAQILLTTIEKAIVRMDHDAYVERTIATYNTKPSFF